MSQREKTVWIVSMVFAPLASKALSAFYNKAPRQGSRGATQMEQAHQIELPSPTGPDALDIPAGTWTLCGEFGRLA